MRDHDGFKFEDHMNRNWLHNKKKPLGAFVILLLKSHISHFRIKRGSLSTIPDSM